MTILLVYSVGMALRLNNYMTNSTSEHFHEYNILYGIMWPLELAIRIVGLCLSYFTNDKTFIKDD